MSESEETKRVTWVPPDFEGESGEYFENKAAQDYLYKKGIEWSDLDDYMESMSTGEAEELTTLEGIKNLADEEEFEEEIQDPSYAKNYVGMQKKYEDTGEIELPMPIVLRVGKDQWLLSGNRRIHFAKRNNVAPTVWVVTLKKMLKIASMLDAVASSLESRGYIKETREVDRITDQIEE